MTDTNIPEVLKAVKEQGFVVFTQGDYNLNIVGVRHPNQLPDIFNDSLYCIFKVSGEWEVHKFEVTTDPSIYWLMHPMRGDGTAILKHPQQMRASYKLGTHKGTYPCLVQCKPVQVWRDNNCDEIIDNYSKLTNSSSWGIQIHRANSKWKSKRISKWSAGCTVFSDPQEYDKFMKIIQKSIEVHPTWDKFTYTLIQGVFK